METYRHQIILFFIILYMVMCIGIGIWAMRKTKSTKDFFMAGRDLGIFVTAFAVFASTLSGFGFVGGPGLIYRMGMSSVWMIVCSSIGLVLAFYLLSKRLRMFGEVRDTVSLSGAVAARYNSEMSRFLTALAIILGVIGYLSAQVKAMATVLQNILINNPDMPDLSLEWCMGISCTVLVFYCVTGGIIAGVYTDMIQGAMMIGAAVLVFFTALSVVDGGMTGAVTTIMKDDPEAMSPWGTVGMMGCLAWYFMFAVGYAGQPHIITKMMMNKKISDAKYILIVSMIAYALSALLWLSIGLIMRALVLQGGHQALGVADDAAPQFLQFYAHPVLAGIVFAGLFAAIMSTADSFLNIGAAAAVHDIPKAIWGRAIENELAWARIATAMLAVLAAFFALYSPEGFIALLGAFGWGTFAAALAPTVAIGFNWKRATATAANVAIASSLIVNFSIQVLKMVSNFKVPYGINSGALALGISLMLFFSISFLSKPPVLDKDIEEIMEM
jgi:SSS family transporter